jgi:hypothetical protein
VELKLTRETYTNKSTIGRLAVDVEFACFTLEDRVRPVKIKGQTAIQAGKYEVVITWSNRFRKSR